MVLKYNTHTDTHYWGDVEYSFRCVVCFSRRPWYLCSSCRGEVDSACSVTPTFVCLSCCDEVSHGP